MRKVDEEEIEMLRSRYAHPLATSLLQLRTAVNTAQCKPETYSKHEIFVMFS